MHATWPAMPDDAERGYALWVGPAGRNASEVARMLGIPRTTVHSWASRYRWQDRVTAEDRDERDTLIAAAYARMARSLPRAVGVLESAIAGEDVGKPALSAAFGILDRYGLSPVQRGTLDVTARAVSSSPVTDAELDRLVAAGDVASLLALATGRPVPSATAQPAAEDAALPALPARTGDDAAT